MHSEYKQLQLQLLKDNFLTFCQACNDYNVLSISNETGMNILHYYISINNSLSYKKKEIIEFLIKIKGLPINQQDKEGLTALYFAVVEKSYEVIEILLSLNADLSIPDINGSTPLFRAIKDYRGEDNVLKIINLLINYGGDLNAVNKAGVSPLMHIQNLGEGIDEGLNPIKWDLRGKLDFNDK